MLYNSVINLIKITEDFPKTHKVIETYIEPQRENKLGHKPSNIGIMSPIGLYRKKGLNITQYKKIMKKYL
jgi:hypothetical protein